MTDDLKKRVDAVLKVFEIRRESISENLRRVGEYGLPYYFTVDEIAEVRSVIKALTEREAAFVALLQECKDFLPEYDECKPRLGSNNKLYILHKEIDATLSRLELEGEV